MGGVYAMIDQFLCFPLISSKHVVAQVIEQDSGEMVRFLEQLIGIRSD